ncbi:hypothetical protein AMK01_PD00626 (plasmid) [Rhizobium sp. N6212]|nr:hypothetical protein AMK01_PD00626 [Rhizobium sp. N6212]ANL01557.1 hypothetical protein AMK00_PD00624 [Rhizobium sp. N621]ANL07685.1 hypothetical protein AMJ99_PD00631 [Rhizobium esperanzae]ANL13855.1 hypothetical protein AMJ98_PE00631 [Rhizobium sp. N1341]ANL25840.1 hypothetical protein AMJ96_PD00640 [Rhizobium sp. N113]ANM38526.1 hypothetical protein AMK04_PD00632 [Rhizobium sp. N871]ANM44680.1 hypothetical protein AMK03_PE00632 [Rhizobium sp. N741]
MPRVSEIAPADTSGRRMTFSTSAGSVDDARRPASRSIMLASSPISSKLRAERDAKGVMQHQVLEVDEFAVDPSEAQESAKYVRSIQPAPTGKRAMRSSRGQRSPGVRDRPQ